MEKLKQSLILNKITVAPKNGVFVLPMDVDVHRGGDCDRGYEYIIEAEGSGILPKFVIDLQLDNPMTNFRQWTERVQESGPVQHLSGSEFKTIGFCHRKI